MVKGCHNPSPPFTTLHLHCLSHSDLLPLMPLRYLSEFLLGFLQGCYLWFSNSPSWKRLPSLGEGWWRVVKGCDNPSPLQPIDTEMFTPEKWRVKGFCENLYYFCAFVIRSIYMSSRRCLMSVLCLMTKIARVIYKGQERIKWRNERVPQSVDCGTHLGVWDLMSVAL